MGLVRNFQIRECLVIFEQDIVPRMMRLDQITFQNECFHIAGGNDIFKIADFRDEPLGFAVMAACKIRTHAIFQHFGLAHVNDRSLFVLH
ncbi:hypothetical protein D3C77_443030 [compost metagenome]